jgi:hypothetical protein
MLFVFLRVYNWRTKWGVFTVLVNLRIAWISLKLLAYGQFHRFFKCVQPVFFISNSLRFSFQIIQCLCGDEFKDAMLNFGVWAPSEPSHSMQFGVVEWNCIEQRMQLSVLSQLCFEDNLMVVFCNILLPLLTHSTSWWNALAFLIVFLLSSNMPSPFDLCPHVAASFKLIWKSSWC